MKPVPKPKKCKSTNLRKSAKGRDCQIRIPGVCNFNPETVVLCHLPGGGMGGKSLDIHGAYGCSECHQMLDGVQSTFQSSQEVELLMLWFYDGVIRTQTIMFNEGLIRVGG